MDRDSSGYAKRWAGALMAIVLLIIAAVVGVNHFQKKIGPADE
jgi:hypothetical protein